MSSRNAPCVTTLKQVAASPSEGEGGGGALEGSLGVGEPQGLTRGKTKSFHFAMILFETRDCFS